MMIDEVGPDIHVRFLDLGPMCEHNLVCWMCDKNKAQYQMNEGIFFPCRSCQAQIPSPIWTKNQHPVLSAFVRKFIRDRFLRVW